MTDRICITCKSSETRIVRGKYEQWHKYAGGFKCDKCYCRNRPQTDKSKIYYKEYANKYRYKLNEYDIKHRRALRGKVLNILGCICTCCGDTNEHYLEIDHIIPQRGTRINSTTVHRDIVKLGSKALDKYQVLCRRCNLNKKCKEKCTIDHTKDKYIIINKNKIFNSPSSLVYTV